MKTQIIRIFFIVLAGVVFSSALHADLTVGHRIRLRNDISGRDGEFLRRLNRQLERLRKLEGHKRSSSNDLIIIAGRKKFLYTGRELHLPGDASLWESDPELRRRIYGVLVAHRFNLDYPAASDGVPLWIVAGIDNWIMSAETAGQYVAGNSSFPLLSSICGNDGTLPDFGALCRLEFPQMAVADDFAAEQARLLLEIFARNRRIRELFAGVFAGEKVDFWLSWYVSPAEAQRSLQRDAAKLLFDRFNPMPVAMALEKIAEQETFFVPALGADGKPTGKILDGDIGVFCEQLALKRPDGAGLRREAAAQWRLLGRALTLEERELCQAVANILLKAGENSDVPEEFRTAVAELKTALNRRLKRTKFLNQTLDRMTPPMLRWRSLLRAVDDDEAALSERQRDFFNRTLDIYLR